MTRDEESGLSGGWGARIGIAAMVVLLVGALIVAKVAEAPPRPEGSACAPCPL